MIDSRLYLALALLASWNDQIASIGVPALGTTQSFSTSSSRTATFTDHESSFAANRNAGAEQDDSPRSGDTEVDDTVTNRPTVGSLSLPGAISAPMDTGLATSQQEVSAPPPQQFLSQTVIVGALDADDARRSGASGAPGGRVFAHGGG